MTADTLTHQARAETALRIARDFQGRLALDIVAQTQDPVEQAALALGVFTVLLRRCLTVFPINTEVWLSELVRAVLA